MKVWMSHGDKLGKLPEGFHVVATTRNSDYAGIAHGSKSIYGKYYQTAYLAASVFNALEF
jgi:GMP synthase-like glutamine amidotransferase